MKKQNPPNACFPNCINFCSFRNVTSQIRQDKNWTLCQTFDKEVSDNIPTWGAFNSLLNPVPEISICQDLPLRYAKVSFNFYRLVNALCSIKDGTRY